LKIPKRNHALVGMAFFHYNPSGLGYNGKMDKGIKAYLKSIGKKGGQSSSEAKVKAAKKNGLLGGRPTLYKEKTAYQTMKEVAGGEDWKIAYMNFVDGFRRRPSVSLIEKDPKSIQSDPKMYALIQSICIQLCLEHNLPAKGWLTKRAFLSTPWFVSGMKSLYAMALKESPAPFRKNNIFVLGNFLARI